MREKFKRFEGMSNEDIKKMGMKEFEVYESNRMETEECLGCR